MVHVLLKPSLENYQHYFVHVWDDCNCAVVWAFFATAFLWVWNENWPFPVLWPCWVFQICWHVMFSSVQFSRSVVSDSLRPHESQHARPPCPSPTPGVHSDSCPLSQWCHPAISSSVIPFSSCPQSLPASKSFPMSQLFAWGSQSTGVSALASFLPKKSQVWSSSEWAGWISLTKGLSRVFSNTTVQKHQFFRARGTKRLQSSLHVTDNWTLAKGFLPVFGLSRL